MEKKLEVFLLLIKQAQRTKIANPIQVSIFSALNLQFIANPKGKYQSKKEHINIDQKGQTKKGNQMGNKDITQSSIVGEEANGGDPEYSKDFNSAYQKVFVHR
jgi:hypothetical protein